MKKISWETYKEQAKQNQKITEHENKNRPSVKKVEVFHNEFGDPVAKIKIPAFEIDIGLDGLEDDGKEFTIQNVMRVLNSYDRSDIAEFLEEQIHQENIITKK
jgi:hypothetical protein